jgi:hypothetical protein
MMADGPHGLRCQPDSADMLALNEAARATCFPTAVTAAATWDPALYAEEGAAIGREAAAAGVEVLAIPGPTAMASALSVSGFDTREFAFYGFLPRGKKELREKLLAMKKSGVPVGVVLRVKG